MERKQRLKELKQLIELHRKEERSFDLLYSKLNEEYQIEFDREPDFLKNSYLNNLRQTKSKQAREYQNATAKKQTKGDYARYKEFVSAFLQDVREAIGSND